MRFFLDMYRAVIHGVCVADTNSTSNPTPLTLTRGAVLVSRCEDWGWVGMFKRVSKLGPKTAITLAGTPAHWSTSGRRVPVAELTSDHWLVVTEERAAAFLAELQELYVKRGKPTTTSWRDEDGYGLFQADAVAALRRLAAEVVPLAA